MESASWLLQHERQSEMTQEAPSTRKPTERWKFKRVVRWQRGARRQPRGSGADPGPKAKRLVRRFRSVEQISHWSGGTLRVVMTAPAAGSPELVKATGLVVTSRTWSRTRFKPSNSALMFSNASL